MPLSHQTMVFAVEDAKIAKLTADPTGGTATYATSIDVPGIKSMEISGDIEVKDLRGDNTLLATMSTLQNVEVEMEFAKFSYDLLPVFLGGTTTDAGTTPNQTTTWAMTTPTFSYFKLEGKTPTSGVDTVGGDMHVVLHKCILTEFPEIGFSEEDFRTSSVSARAQRVNATGNAWVTITMNETAAANS